MSFANFGGSEFQKMETLEARKKKKEGVSQLNVTLKKPKMTLVFCFEEGGDQKSALAKCPNLGGSRFRGGRN